MCVVWRGKDFKLPGGKTMTMQQCSEKGDYQQEGRVGGGQDGGRLQGGDEAPEEEGRPQ